jgi:hypothetical protein
MSWTPLSGEMAKFVVALAYINTVGDNELRDTSIFPKISF